MKKIKNYLTYVMLLFILVSPIQAAKREDFILMVYKTMDENPKLSCENISAIVLTGVLASGFSLTMKGFATFGTTGNVPATVATSIFGPTLTVVSGAFSHHLAYNICTKRRSKK